MDLSQIALCQLCFNLIGITIWYPAPIVSSVPVGLARTLGQITRKYSWFAMVYITIIFFFLPLFLFAISLPGLLFFLGVAFLITFVFFCISVLQLLQQERPNWLPVAMRTWAFLPLCMTSLALLDRQVVKLIEYCSCQKHRQLDSKLSIDSSNIYFIREKRESNVTFDFDLIDGENSADSIVVESPAHVLITTMPACYEYKR